MWLGILNIIPSKKDGNDSGSKPKPETQNFIRLETGFNSNVILAEDGSKILTEVQQETPKGKA